MAKVFIVEDHPIMRQSYLLVLKRAPELIVCGEAQSAEEALIHIPIATPDIVLVDFSLPGMNGLELVQILQQEHPQLPTVVISGHHEETFIEGILAAGATGYIVKEQMAQQLIDTIRQILDALTGPR
ncbi:MAG: response regulator transcription factor [Caldilineaceae bacterium]|nr:response regulator transcription factor [Caldilineaceae bacterium]